MQIRTRFITLRRLSGLALSALIAAPLVVASPSAEAAPKFKDKGNWNGRGPGRGNGYGRDNAPGRANRRPDSGRYGDDYGYGNPGYGDSGYGYNDRERRTLDGVVTRDLGGRRFEMRANGGRVFTVRLRREEPNRLSPGDRVRVEGSFLGGRENNRGNGGDARADFVADSLQIISNNGSGGGFGGGYYGGGVGDNRRVSFPGTVLNRGGSRRITVRGDNGRTYTVESRSSITRVDDGDRVRVEGLSRNGIITDARVVLANNTDNGTWNNGGGFGYGGYGEGQNVEFVGRVTRVDTRDNVITVRDERTGRSFTFRPRQAEDFRSGQSVRATLTVRDGRPVLTRVSRI